MFLLSSHLVFVTKYRKKVFSNEMLLFMERVLHLNCKKMNCKLKEFNGEMDHVHLLIEYKANISISKIVNQLKGTSSFYLRRKFPELQKKNKKGHLWSSGYFTDSVGGAPIEILKKYISKQNRPS